MTIFAHHLKPFNTQWLPHVPSTSVTITCILLSIHGFCDLQSKCNIPMVIVIVSSEVGTQNVERHIVVRCLLVLWW
jgi:hypothetical protein